MHFYCPGLEKGAFIRNKLDQILQNPKLIKQAISAVYNQFIKIPF